MLINWQTILRINYPALYQQFLSEEDAATQAPYGERFIAHNAVLTKWARRVGELLMEAKTGSVATGSHHNTETGECVKEKVDYVSGQPHSVECCAASLDASRNDALATALSIRKNKPNDR